MTGIHLHTDGIRCSFCGKPKREVFSLIAAPEAYAICDECITVAIELMAGQIGCNPSEVYAQLMLRRLERQRSNPR